MVYRLTILSPLSLFLQLNSGILLYYVDLGSGPEAIAASGQVVSDAAWHSVAVSRRGLEVTLVVDETVFTHTLLGTELTLDVSQSGIFAGGRPVAGGIEGGYLGCLQVRTVNYLVFLSTLVSG